MNVSWLKRMMPRGIYGRAALIMIVPILAIQLVVSTVFIQRHFEGVTRQMTQGVAVGARLVLSRLDRSGDSARNLAEARALAAELGIALASGGTVSGDSRKSYDLPGRVIIETLRDELVGVRDVDLSNLRDVRVVFSTPQGDVQMTFDRRRMTASNPHQLLVIMVLASLIFTLISFLFLRNQLRPIRRLSRAAEAFGRGRTIAYRPSGATEVRAAGNAFLDMRSRIERQIEQRTMMLSGVSHDLRTPLTRMKLTLSMMEDGEETRALAKDIEDMRQMIEAFLDFARSDATEGETIETDPVALMATIIEDARRAGQNVTLISVSGQGTVHVRVGAYRRAIENLIGNAVKYGKRCEVSLVIMEASVRVTVEDDGPGIPKNRREQALKPFTRLDTARNQDSGGGVGLGLAIASDVARGHGGTLRLDDSTRMGGLRVDLIVARDGSVTRSERR